MKIKKIFTVFVNSTLTTLLAITLMETVSYPGFFLKRLNIYLVLVTLSVFITAFLFFLKFYKTKILNKTLFLLAIIAAAVYTILDILEIVNYPNFVFSHFHIHLYLFLLALLIFFIIFLLNVDRKKLDKLIYLLVFLAAVKFLVNGLDKVEVMKIVFISKNLNMSYEEKMRLSVGKISYDYADFIKDNTETESTILIPPQAYPWPQTSNKGYLRYFIYPRKLINGNEKDSKVDLKLVDYVMINHGETEISEYGYTNVWPKFDVKGEYTVYWDRETGNVYRDDTGVYKYDENDKTEKWGLIKLRKK